MNTPETSLLGKVATYADLYDAALLYPLPRAAQREQIGITDRPIFLGADLWTAYELSWLNARGKPQVALGRFTVPSESTHLVESKSLKLYLNSFNNTVFADIDAVRQTLQKDLSEAVWRGGVVNSSVGVQLMSPEQYAKENRIELKVFPADWNKHGRAAGPIRNAQMGDYADQLVAVWDGKSKGTKNMIDYMNKLMKPVYIIWVGEPAVAHGS
jgi:NADPH-dependent 7-cyano-7-deazaguanine reductase QueF-like protein